MKGRESNVFESLYKNEAGKEKRKAAMDKAEERFENEHTFHPDVRHNTQFSEEQLEKWQLKPSDPGSISQRVSECTHRKHPDPAGGCLADRATTAGKGAEDGRDTEKQGV